jgi:acyl dehydratase
VPSGGAGSQSVRFRVDELAARRFAQAVGDLNPRYFDEAAGIAPPTFITSQTSWEPGPLEEDLRYDGVNTARFPGAFTPGRTVLGGSQEIELVRPVLIGEELEVTVQAVETYERESAAGRLLLSVIEARFTDTEGKLVTVVRDTVISTPPAFGREA